MDSSGPGADRACAASEDQGWASGAGSKSVRGARSTAVRHRVRRPGTSETVRVLSSRSAAQNLPEAGVEGAETSEAGYVRMVSALTDVLLRVCRRRGGRVRDDMRQRRLLGKKQEAAQASAQYATEALRQGPHGRLR